MEYGGQRSHDNVLLGRNDVEPMVEIKKARFLRSQRERWHAILLPVVELRWIFLGIVDLGLDNPHRAGLRDHHPQRMGAMGRWLLAGLRSILVPRATQTGVHAMPRPIV